MSEKDAGSWAFIYHLFALSYGWTVQEVDQLTYPQLMALVEQIKGCPTMESLTARANAVHAESEADVEIEKQLQRMPNVTTRSELDNVPARFTRTGSKLVRIMRKRDGKDLLNG